MPDNTYALSKVYHGQGGDNLVVAAGGTLTVEAGSAFTVPGGYPLAASAAGHRAVYGSVTVTGTQAVALTGTLSAVSGAVATIGTALAADPYAVSAVPSGATVNLTVYQSNGSVSTTPTPVQYAVFGPAA